MQITTIVLNMKNKKINIIIQARMASTRLPGKVLRLILHRPMLDYLIERVNFMHTPHSLIIATTTNPRDDVIESFAKTSNTLLFRGSEEDVLDRYYQTCCVYPADIIVRITSDCPLMDPVIIDHALHQFQNNRSHLDYLSNTLHRTFPRGMDIEVFTFEALEIAAKEASNSYDREHVTPFLYRHPERFHLSNFTHNIDISKYRLTVDTPEDFLLISKIFEDLYPKNKKFTLEDILQGFNQHPAWQKINAHIKQKEV